MTERAGTERREAGRRLAKVWRGRRLAGLLAVSLLGAACADLDGATTAVSPADGGAIAETTASSPTTAPALTDTIPSTGAGLGTTALGEVLVGPDGRSLYAFTNDTQASSTCYGTCAEDWPPVLVGEDWDVSPELDSGIFATTVRDDGQLQLVAGRWPLYHYAGDEVPGDIDGHGLGDVWFLVDPTGTLLEATPDPADAGEPDPAPGTTEGGGYTDGY